MTISTRDTVKYAAVLRALRMGCTVASAAVLLLLWSWLLDMVERAETEAFAHVRIIAEERARSVADAMQTSIERLDFALLTVRHISQAGGETKTEWDRFVVDSLGVQGVQIARIDANGYAASFSRNAFLRGYVGDRGFFSSLKTLPGDPLLIDTPALEQGGARPAWIIPFSRKARVSGPFSGTITLLVPAGIWQAQFAQYLGAKHDAIAVLSSDGGKYILRLPDPDSAYGRYTPSEWPALFRRETDHGHFVGRGVNDNLERLIAWVRLPSGPIATAGIAFDDVLAPAWALERALKIGGGIFSVLVILLTGSLAAALTISEKSLRACDEREILYRNLMDNMTQGVMHLDANGRILHVNAAFSAITGYAPENVLGKSPGMLSPTHDEARNLGRMIEQWIEEGGNAAGEGDFDGLRARGATRPFTGHALLMAHTGTDARRIVLISDVSAERRERAEIWRAANFDTLTGLANRELMHDHLELMTNHALVQHDCGVAVLFIGLDYFVPVSIRNNSDIAMRLRYEIAHRLRGIFHAEDTIACLRDDHFAVLLPDYGSASVADRAAARVVSSLSGGFAVDEDAHVEITCHVGVARLPDNGKTPGELLHSAEQAMLRARERGRSCWSV
ncbi:MAG: diguanylate cyclase [Azoarcus sp.]|jgi:PAS domain S-box-containing protein/diguanylate cyclase (GGDEF)-like protein|nr:diguanylate cyclase [Azoarcus sp.]